MLLQPALEAGEAITPLAIAYDVIGGDPKTDVAYRGDATFFPHLLRLARLERIIARVLVAPAPALPPDRKIVARILHESVVIALHTLRN
jgi:hypothetical protein